jgi:hypothetical protein
MVFLFLAGKISFSFLQRVETDFGSHGASFSMGSGAISPELQGLGLKLNNDPI